MGDLIVQLFGLFVGVFFNVFGFLLLALAAKGVVWVADHFDEWLEGGD